MSVFFYICEYFEITPEEFFQTKYFPSKEFIEVSKKLQSLDPEKQKHIFAVINDL